MRRAFGPLAMICMLTTPVCPLAAAEPGKGLPNPFFPYCVNLPDQVLEELGYTPLHNLYVGIYLDKSPPYAPGLKEQIRKLKGTGTIFWLTLIGGKVRPNDDKAVEILRDLAAVADEVGVRVAIYPHYGNYVATAREGLTLVQKVDRKNVGLTINLCHELMSDMGAELPQIIDEVASLLFVVTVNGADVKEKGERTGWDRLIQPLGQGSFDTYAFLKKVREVGFQGPIGLQCYGLKGDPLVHLKQSIATWKAYRARMAADSAGAEKSAASTAAWWLARPAQTEPKILAWAKAHPDLVALEPQKTLGGHTAYAVTVTNRKINDAKKRKLIVVQPHAHEPAATAGMMSFLAQLLDGADLAGQPANLERQKILDQTLLTFIPDGNPDGRAKSPADWWDGSNCSNEEFIKLAFGRERDGRMAPRVGRWSDRQRQPAQVGFVYEKISDHEYVEPNRDLESTYFKLIRRMRGRYQYNLLLDLHQTEFERSKNNCMIILPFMQKQLPQPIQDGNLRWGRAVVAAWQKAGESPIVEVRPLGYGEDQLQYFRKCWGDIYPVMPCLCVEIQNNSPRTPPRTQMRLMEIAIQTCIQAILAEGS